MSRNSSAKYFQNNKERLQKTACERYESFLKKKKKNSYNMVVNNTKIYQKIIKKGLLSIENIIIK